MKVIIQRVLQSSVMVDGKVVGSIDEGFVLLVGFSVLDTADVIGKMIDKIVHLRIFEDCNHKMNVSLVDMNYSVLSISQFTLYANCKKGRRPSFIDAASGEEAFELYGIFNRQLEAKGLRVETGIFGADMKVSLVNDGPCTIILNSEDFF